MAFKVNEDYKIEFRKSTDEDNRPAISVILYHKEAEGEEDYGAKVTNGYYSIDKRDEMFKKLNTQEGANDYWNEVFGKIIESFFEEQ